MGRDLQDTITYLKRSSGAVAFEHVFTYFEQKYGQRKGLGIQAAWKALKIPAQGALTLAKFRRFRLGFMQVWQQLPEVSESEAYRHLSGRILPWMTEKIYKKEKDKNRLSKKLIVHPGFPDASEDECKEGVNAWIGVTPLEVKALGEGEFECTMGSDEKMEALLAINMRVIQGTPRVIRVRRAEVLLTVIEAFNLIEDLMVNREEIQVRKGVEAKTHAVGVEEEKSRDVSPHASFRCPVQGGFHQKQGWLA